MMIHRRILIALLVAAVLCPGRVLGGQRATKTWVGDAVEECLLANYSVDEYVVPMRDGTRLFTVVYTPQDGSTTYPILLERTPYGTDTVGQSTHRRSWGPGLALVREGFIIARQEVRGTYQSPGEFSYMTPHIVHKQTDRDVDESTDTYDTVEWLLANIPNHNGHVGLWGVSYSGYCAAAGMIDAHSAVKAVSPQGPNTDFWFDHFRSNGAFLLLPALEFVTNYGEPALGQGDRWHRLYIGAPTDGYRFLLDLGPLSNLDLYYLKGQRPFWKALAEHPNYDEFWRSRTFLPHLKNVAPAVMTVGGWFDSENLYGSLKCYRALEKQNPGITNVLVMGPWERVGWLGGYESRGGLGDISFGSDTAEFFQEHIELPFFNRFLKGKESATIPEAYVFVTGQNEWRSFDNWPPRGRRRSLYLRTDGGLSYERPVAGSNQAAGARDGWDEFESDPLNPVPFARAVTDRMPPGSMVEDQRFVGARRDVLLYETGTLDRDVTIAGPLVADLWVSTSETDADWIVKLIDGFPSDAAGRPAGTLVKMIGYQMLVRGGVIRGRFRNDAEHPERFVPNEPARVTFELQDICHTFKAGHRIMVQIQSSWFPFVDRNPQKYVENIFEAEEWQFTPATHRVFRSGDRLSRLEVNEVNEVNAANVLSEDER